MAPYPSPSRPGRCDPSTRDARRRICRRDTARRRLRALALALGLLCGGLGLGRSGPAVAEIYRWKDEQGRLHFAQDLSQVPPRFRAQAAGGKLDEGAGRAIQTYQAPPPAAVPARSGSRSRAGRSARPDAQPVHRIRVQRAGSSMRVDVRLNDSVIAPFILDTGASDVVIPESVAQELGLPLDGARTALYGTANGVVESKLVTLDSVELGGARAEKVPASISRSMSIGLLGLSFFNHFEYQIDPGAGIVTLRPNGLVEDGHIRGGRSRSQWQGQYESLAQRRQAIERALENANPNASRRRGELEAALLEVERQYEALEDEADDARVPMQWRD